MDTTQSSTSELSNNGIGEMFSALKYANCRAWFSGLFMSLMGFWMTYNAISFFIYELTGSAAYLGYAGFALGLPGWVFTLVGGVIADRIPRRKLILATLVYYALLILAAALLVFSGHVRPWHILVFALGLGIGYAFNSPVVQAFVADLVERKDLTNAIALNGMLFNADTALAPGLLGLMYARYGPAWCFAVCGFLFLPAILAVLWIKLPKVEMAAHATSALADLQDGMRYILNQPVIYALLLNMAVFSMLEVFLVILMPAWSVNVLGGDVQTNGFLLSVRGVGAIVGGLTVAAMGSRPIRGRVLMGIMFLVPVFMLVFALLRWIPLVAFLLFLEGWGFIVFITTTNSLIQSHVQESMRGRVMSVYSLILFGGMPVGSLIGGTIANYWGEPSAVISAAVAILLMAGWVWLKRPKLRQLA